MPALDPTGVVARVSSKLVLVGGTIHSGWLPAGASRPLPDPVRALVFSFEIQFDGSGYLLCSQSQDKELFSDTWHETLEAAQAAALEDFGVQPLEWQYAAPGGEHRISA